MDHDRTRKLGSWLDSVPKGELKKYRELTCSQERVKFGTIPVSGTLRGHSSSLQQLTHITLRRCHVSTGELVALINCFPNLNYINLEYPIPLHDTNQQISLTRQHPLEELRIANEGMTPPKVFDELPEPKLHFNEIVFENNNPAVVSANFVNHILHTFGTGAKTLRLPVVCKDHLTLSPCSELRDLEYNVTSGPGRDWEWEFISSIGSTNIERITIKSTSIWRPMMAASRWWRIDEILTGLMELPERESGLALEVRFEGPWAKNGLDISLPKFVEKGGRWSSCAFGGADTDNVI